MDGRLLVRFFTTYAICVPLVIAVPQVIAWLFPVFWVEEGVAIKLVYIFGSLGFLGWRGVFQYHPEDQGFGYNFGKPLLLRGLLSTFCWLVGLSALSSPLIGLYLVKLNWWG